MNCISRSNRHNMQNKRTIVLFIIFLSLGLCLAFTAHQKNAIIYLTFLWSSRFQYLIKFLLALAFALLTLRLLIHLDLPQKALKIIYGIIFLPIILLPAFRCCFKVPYVFCNICPNKCPWGMSRVFVFNSFLLLNLSGKFWCTYLCPMGTFQECQTQLTKLKIMLPSYLRFLPYMTIFSYAGLYFLPALSSNLVSYFAIWDYEWVTTTALIAAIITAISFFVPKFWCRYLCPVGTIAGLTFSLKNKLTKSK